MQSIACATAIRGCRAVCYQKFQLKFCNCNMPHTPRRCAIRECQQNMALHYFFLRSGSGASQTPALPPAAIVRSIVPKILVARWRPSCQQARINLAAHKTNYSYTLNLCCCYCIFYFYFAVYCKFAQHSNPPQALSSAVARSHNAYYVTAFGRKLRKKILKYVCNYVCVYWQLV